MYQRLHIGLEEAQLGVEAALAAAAERRLAIAVAVVDHRGDLVAFAAQDRVIQNSRGLCVRKAYAAAIGRRSTSAFAALASVPVELLLGPSATSAQGGLAILSEGVEVGGVGVSGADSPEDDEMLAAVAIDAMGLKAR